MGGGRGGGVRGTFTHSSNVKSGDSSVVKAPGLVIEGSRVRVPGGAAGEFLFTGVQD